jgi:fructose-1-phosphate kinase PfkB-like protein
VDSLCPIGAGDALTAAYTWAIEKKKTPVDAMRWGVAAGTATATLPGMRFASLEQTQDVFERVELRRAE